MKQILFVCHCVLNTASKVKEFDLEAMEREEQLRLDIMRRIVERGIQVVQLPCPEFLQYGSLRHGHCADQFDNPFFRKQCREMLEPIVLQLEEYLSNEQDFEVLGIMGIDGSPSCGVRYTSRAVWSDEPDGSDRTKVFKETEPAEGKGVFIQVLVEMLQEKGIDVPLDALFAPEPERALSLLEGKHHKQEK